MGYSHKRWKSSIVYVFQKIISEEENQIKYGLTKVANFTIILLKIFKHMTVISKNVYFDVLDDIVNKHNNAIHTTIKMKPVDVTSDSYTEYNKDFNKKSSKFKVGDHVEISK